MPPVPQNTPTAAPTGSTVASSLDPKIVNLARAIRTVESSNNFTQPGKSGEYGAYQFMPATWAGASQKFLGQAVPLKQATPQQQNEVAYKQLAEWAQQHPDWNVGNFASAWNAGPGKPNAYQEGYTGTNAQGVVYDTPAYAKKVAETYQQIKGQGGLGGEAQPQLPPQAPEAPPSVAGFAGNVVKSGAGLLAGVGEAILHPVQTIQNLGGTVVGGLEKAAGESTDNTQKFDSLVSFFKDRYGSLSNLEKTLYHDPVGVAADLSTIFGGAGLAARGLKVGADVAKAGEVSSVLGKTAGVLDKASDYTNPLGPIAKGISAGIKPATEIAAGAVGKIAGLEPATIEAIRLKPDSFTPTQIATVTRDNIASEVESAFSKRIKSLSDTGKEYDPVREIGKVNNSFSSESMIPVARNFLEEQFRNTSGLDVKDGEIVATGNSSVRNASDISKLQKTFDLWKPVFQKGALTPNEFLNFRSDMAELAKFGLAEKKSSVLQNTSKEIRANFNNSYRGNIPGLEELDLKFAKQQDELQTLKKGLIKEGKLTDNATNLIANAGNKGNEARLARLEEVLPGITDKLKVLKAIEDIKKSEGSKVGTYNRSILETGGVVGGIATGSLPVVAAGIATAIIAEPSMAVKLIRASEKIDPKITSLVLSRLARYATMGGEGDRATGMSPQDQTEEQRTQNPIEGAPDVQDLSSLNPAGSQ